MKIEKILLVFLIVGLIPSVMGVSFTLNCPISVAAQTDYTCTLTSPDINYNNFGGLDFVLSLSGHTLNSNPSSDVGSVLYNSGTGKGALGYDFSSTTGSILKFNLKSATASGTVTLSEVMYYDVNSVKSTIPSLSAVVAVSGGSPILTNSVELCTGGQDEDGDGRVDCLDPDCTSTTSCLTTQPGTPTQPGLPVTRAELCDNQGVDEDGDHLVDCNDPNCATAPLCQTVDIPPPDTGSQVCLTATPEQEGWLTQLLTIMQDTTKSALQKAAGYASILRNALN